MVPDAQQMGVMDLLVMGEDRLYGNSNTFGEGLLFLAANLDSFVPDHIRGYFLEQ